MRIRISIAGLTAICGWLLFCPAVSAGEAHWAFRPLEPPVVPENATADWARTPMDHFVFAKLEEEKLTPSPQADPATLPRRIYLDLIGLPPSPSELDEFGYRAEKDKVRVHVSTPRFSINWDSITRS